MAHMRADDRRRLFIDAAAKVVAEEGVARATTRRITEVAGAPTASLHYVFEGKDALLRAVLEQGPIDGRLAGARFVPPGIGLSAGVEALMRGYLAWIVDDIGWQQAQFELMLWATRTPSARHLPGQVYRSYLDHTVELLSAAAGEQRHAVDLSTLASQMLAALDGLTLQAIAGQRSDLPTMVDRAIENLCCWLASSERESIG
ncbi:TetR/AcrR family transcriptional regulator [Gordonia sp. TBRC 11910]|uniref:TetR/AcrR family transcriptional regulator n=1 Tax=Gordonia asplenii TaxID=2725283 RepID=A0A848KVF2_9ACTN|nr:TetR/AcrR family transcriptional regulator [Gordonia asplenii]NMO02249.1 TetR/AcrR family transcriptional regulator [Gordonia asplenii]